MENVNQSAPVESREHISIVPGTGSSTSENFAIKMRRACGIVRVAKQIPEYNDSNIQVIFFRNKGIKMGFTFLSFVFNYVRAQYIADVTCGKYNGFSYS